MNSELLSLSKIFTENLFRIPDYQRGYSWTDRQLKDFWSDLVLLDDDRGHYIGVLTLETVTDEQMARWTDDLWIIRSKRYTPFYVVDGQQRLTTSLILIQAIIEKLVASEELNFTSRDDIRKKFIFESKDKGVSRSYIFGYEKDNPSYEFLKTGIFQEKSDLHGTEERTAYTRNLAGAKAYFAEKISHCDLAAVEKLYTKLTQHFLFNIYTITGDIDVFVAFETMNNRGKPLSHLELLKNRLIFLSTRLNTDDEERKLLRSAVNEAWKTIYHYLGRATGGPLSDDHFLYFHFILYFGSELFGEKENAATQNSWRYRHEEFYKEYLLNEVFTVKRVKEGDEKTEQKSHVSLDRIYAYVQDIKQAVQFYHDLYSPSGEQYTSDQVANLTRLNRIGWAESQSLIMAAMGAGVNSSQLSDLLAALERYIFTLILLIHQPRTTPIQVDLTGLAVQLRTKAKDVATVISALNNASTGQKLTDSAMLAGQMAEEGYYGWRGIRYFLFEYEQFLKGKSRSSRDKLDWDSFASEKYEADYVTVEHVFPQKPKDEYWEMHFSGYSAAQRKSLRNSLGNLLALSRAKNSSLGNRSFLLKRDGSDDIPGYRKGSYSEIEVAESTDWTPQEILKRGHKMLDFLEKRWKVKLGDPAEKAKALGLDFMIAKPTNPPR